MVKKSEFYIQFTGLPDGIHNYQYKVDNTFFTEFNYSDIEDADLIVDLALEKKPNMLIANFSIKGVFTVMCDRCTDSCQVKVKGGDEIIYKFTEEDIDDEKIIAVLPNEIGIDISMPIFEISSLLLPSKRTHKKGGCNEEMLNAIDNYLIVESTGNKSVGGDEDEESNDEIDPRWSALKNLK
ncbi:YceD family protein [Crocinitomix catalasitica]|uniref:YceD family protein n=1 Tax=Crocinitomix catalasitica TaxID=184607 RepID=UPI0004848425|nr:DUF177 domain-containing protein [Crocinitomix catalasitica]